MIRRVLKTEKYIPDDAVFGYTGFTPKGYISCRGTFVDENGNKRYGENYIKMPYQIGDILYVRETWKRFCGMLYGWENGTYIPLDDFEGYQYKAGEQCICTKGPNPLCGGFEDQKSDIRFDDNWHPSIHMPKEAARIFLKVTGVRVEQLQDITIDQIVREGIYIDNTPPDYVPSILTAYTFDRNTYCSSPNLLFRKLWNSTIKKSDLDKYGWDANPWVWVIEFDRI